MLDEGTLVLEGVTLAQVVEFVVEVLVDLAGGTVLDEQTAEDTETTHPLDLTGRLLASCFHNVSFAPQSNASLPSFVSSLILRRSERKLTSAS